MSFDSMFGTAQEQAEADIAAAVEASRRRMDADEARLIAQVESFLAGDGDTP